MYCFVYLFCFLCLNAVCARFIIGTPKSLHVNKYTLNLTELFITHMQGIYNHILETTLLRYTLLQLF